jgi:hypothetical protein
LFRLVRPALAVVAIIGLVAAGCGGSSGTPTPPPISDPEEIITRSVTNVADATSLHFRAEVSGKFDMSSLGEGGGGLGGSIDLAGTYAEGDVDIKNQAADIKFGLPGLLGLSGRIIVVDGYMYTQMSLQGDKYTKSKLDESLPVDIPSPDASASGAIASQVAELRKSLKDAGATATLKADEKVEGKDCYRISLSIPIDKVNDLISENGGSTADMKIDNLSVDYWVYKDSLRPAKVTVSGAATGTGSLTLNAIVSNYDKSVKIEAPDPSQIQEGTGS